MPQLPQPLRSNMRMQLFPPQIGYLKIFGLCLEQSANSDYLLGEQVIIVKVTQAIYHLKEYSEVCGAVGVSLFKLQQAFRH